jgi:hypothetical protein
VCRIERSSSTWQRSRRSTASSPPGGLGGFETLAYWIRALDAAIVGLLVIVAAVFGRLCDPVLLFGAATAS